MGFCWKCEDNLALEIGFWSVGSVLNSFLIVCCREVTSVVSNSVWPHRRKPTRFPRPWGSPGKNTGVGCHFLLQCMKVKSESEFTQSCPTLRDPMDCSPPGSSIHGIFQATALEWGAIAVGSNHFFHVMNMISLCVTVYFLRQMDITIFWNYFHNNC